MLGIWGYNEESIKFLPDMAAAAAAEKDQIDGNAVGNDSVSNRVAGMALKKTLMEHKDAVTGLACFQQGDNHWMVNPIFINYVINSSD